MTNDIAALVAELTALLEKATPGPWSYELDWNEDGEYGPGPDPGRGFWDYTMIDADGRSLFGSENSVAKIIEEDPHDDTAAWDQVAKDNFVLIAAMHEHLPTLLTALTAAQETIRRQREALERYGKHDGLCAIVGGYGYCTCGYDAARAALEPAGETR